MPVLRPFPFPSLSIGTDIAHVPRIARLVASRRIFPRFLRKVLTSREERDFHLRFPQNASGGIKSGRGSSGGEQDSRQDAAKRAMSGLVREAAVSRPALDAPQLLLRNALGDTESQDDYYEKEQRSQWVNKAAMFLAGRWAAKEAVVKACSWRSLTFDEIQILKDPWSKRVYGVILDEPEVRETLQRTPWIQKSDSPGEALVWDSDGDIAGQIVKVSISHDGEYATAVCLAAEETEAGTVL